MRYLGSKTLLVEQIADIAGPFNKGMVFCDPFGGIGTVGAYMKGQGYRVISGDLLTFAHYFQHTLIQCSDIPPFTKLFHYEERVKNIEAYLNIIIAQDGWFIEEYAVKRQYFTLENAHKIQACIDSIWTWNMKGYLNEDEYAVLISSLINSMDKVANTAGTYYAYLKEFYRKACKPFVFHFLEPIKGDKSCKCYLENANELVKNNFCNILYLDPPYNVRDYGRYYHLPETIAKGVIPTPSGCSGVFVQNPVVSQYTQKKEVKAAFTDLIANSKCEKIIFHYTDKGLLDVDSASVSFRKKSKKIATTLLFRGFSEFIM